ncbi:hypothetical protein D9758_012081 [Tetrapyrgos nigripes]|uniref:Alanine dehydrogenase/pyridine nucleotide transhydrogenase N-terminal domain-containing protein n=1 Tax=Tetrapyrgos nigripes TaxID=182062 RepID=A0A8H5CDL4_9AGAR|nr:hypothetical protein D9758_012081 [Tetrapyrgos nigripes]
MKSTMNLKNIARSRVPLTVGIRREDPCRIWERRAPLTPDAVNDLVERRGVQVHVEQCDRRIFTDKEYEQAGATIRPNLQAAHVVLGIKEPPLNELLLNSLPSPVGGSHCARTFLLFSHTAKGQTYNMPLLSSFLANNDNDSNSNLLPTLIDYELLTNEEDGKRTVGFGWFAGVAGVLESLSSMAHSHLELGVASPFLYTPRPHTLPSLSALRASLRAIGTRIANEGTPAALGPFVIGLTGTGNVSQGCLSMLEELPIVHVSVQDLPSLVRNPDTDLRKVLPSSSLSIYLVHAKPADYFIRTAPATNGSTHFDRADYYANPGMYGSVFGERVCVFPSEIDTSQHLIYPYLTLLLNGTGWSPGFPRLMTNEQLAQALPLAKLIDTHLHHHHVFPISGKPPKSSRGLNVGDISCDPEGGLEFLERSSTLSDPFYKVKVQEGLPEVQMMAVDILPTSIPLDASVHFSDGVMRYLEGVLDRYDPSRWNAQSDEEGELRRATIAQGGKLMDKHEWLGKKVDAWRNEQPSPATFTPPAGIPQDPSRKPSGQDQGVLRTKRVLLLGSGMVAGPAVEKMAERSDVKLVVASNSGYELNNLRRIGRVASTGNSVEYKEINVGNKTALQELIGQADVVISLLPVPLHAGIAELCIQQKKHLVTASYISDDMRKLHDRALSSDVLLLNEIGLDPGIDHCSAISLISRLQAQNKQIVSFISFCGGLPSPDVGLENMGPLRYKFSWSPRGVLTAALNAARFKLRGKEYEIPGSRLLESYFQNVPISPTVALEGLPNRDSFPYAAAYGLGDIHSLRTLLRGTLRYRGFSTLMHFFKSLGLLELGGSIQEIRSWRELVPRSQALRRELHPEAEHVDLRAHSQGAEGNTNAQALSWLLSDQSGTGVGFGEGLPRLPKEPMTPLDMFTILLAHKLKYAPHERDMVVMAHEVIARTSPGGVNATSPGAGEEEIHTSSLIAYGDDRYSAMARTVGLPVAIAALAIVDGKVDKGLRGVAGPGHESVREPVLKGLVQVGLGMEESIKKSWVGSLERELGRPGTL